MNDLIDIIIKLRETESAISRMEKVVRDNPESETVLLSLKSILKRQRKLERVFTEAAYDDFQDVCSYRIFGEDDEKPKISTIAKSLGDFQSLLTIIYDAIKSGNPKDTAHVSAESVGETALEFGYSFAGSVGFMMTMPNERLLFGETNLDEAMSQIFKMAKSQDTDQVAVFVKTIGIAPIRKIYQWAEDHVSSGMNVDIKWLRNEQVRNELRVDVQELENLIEVIAKTSEEKTEDIEVEGLLVGADVKTHMFHMTFEDAEEIKGELSEELTKKGEIPINRRYKAKIRKMTKIHYSMEKEEYSHILLSIE